MVGLHANRLRDSRVRNAQVCFTALWGPGSSFLTTTGNIYSRVSRVRPAEHPPYFLAALHISSHQPFRWRGYLLSLDWSQGTWGLSMFCSQFPPVNMGQALHFYFFILKLRGWATIFPGVSSTPNSWQIEGPAKYLVHPYSLLRGWLGY